MRQNSSVIALRFLLPCLLLAVVIPLAFSADTALPTKSVSPLNASAETTGDPFVGDYIGSIHPLGKFPKQSKAGDGQEYEPEKCGNCHTEARIEHSGAGYSLTMIVDHGKDKQGKLQRDRITLKGERRDKSLSFSSEDYSITLTEGQTTRGRIKRMAAEIKLKRKAASVQEPAANGDAQ